MGEVRVGDSICNPDGSVQKVIQTHPQGVKDIYRVTLQDGSSTEVCGEHLWKFTVTSKKISRDGGSRISDWFIGDTREIKKHIESNREGWPSIPLTEPVKYYNLYQQPVDPYILGLIIGDGCLRGSHNLTITTGDQYIVNKVSCIGIEITVTDKDDHKQIFIIGDSGRKMRSYLGRVGLLGKKSIDKFIPTQYQYAPVEDRIKLIQGLMDSDGYVDHRGHMSFTSVSDQLAKDFQQLIRGIGGKATIWSKDASYVQDDGQRVLCSKCYTVQFNTKRNPELVSLPRKKERAKWDYNGGVSELKRRVVDVEFSRKAEAKCITVDNPNSLYITDDFIVTHNSYGMRSWFSTACWNWRIQAVIIRRTRKDLQNNHINPFKAEMQRFIEAGLIKYSERHNEAKFKNGSILSFEYCNNNEDLLRIQGQAYDLMGLEESTQFSEHQINVMISSCRASNIATNNDTDFPNKVLMTFNWGGQSHSYHRRIYWDKDYNPEEDASDHHFIFAPMDSNKILMEKSPEYKKQLRKLPKQLQKAWIDGNPDAFTGSMFNIVDQFHTVDAVDFLTPYNPDTNRPVVPEDWKLFGSLDAGTADPCSFGMYCKTPGGYIYKIFTYYVADRNPVDHVEAIVDRILRCPYTNGRKPEYVLADRHAFQKRGKNQIVAHDITWQDLFREHGIYLKKATDDRISGSHAMQYALDYKYDYENDRLIRKPKLMFFRNDGRVSNGDTIKELMGLKRDENRPEDIDQKAPDHAYDETRYAIMGAISPFEYDENPQEPVDEFADYGRDRDIEKVLDEFSGTANEDWQTWY